MTKQQLYDVLQFNEKVNMGIAKVALKQPNNPILLDMATQCKHIHDLLLYIEKIEKHSVALKNIASGILPNGDHVEGAVFEYASKEIK